MILSDTDILKFMEDDKIIVKPFIRESLGSNSIDLHLGSTIGTYNDTILDAKLHNKISLIEIPEDGYVLLPSEFYLGVTMEYTESRGVVPFIDGKSSIGRLGISIHETAGVGDDGFCGYWTLEISVNKPVRVYAGMEIGQIFYFKSSSVCINPYNKKKSSKYNNQPGTPIESMMWKNKF